MKEYRLVCSARKRLSYVIARKRYCMTRQASCITAYKSCNNIYCALTISLTEAALPYFELAGSALFIVRCYNQKVDAKMVNRLVICIRVFYGDQLSTT